MTDPSDFVALSLLPIWSWREVAERLRAGAPPADILRQIADHRWPDQPDRIQTLRAGARDALAQAAAREIAPIAWSDASYPVALTTIVDPPPVLWARGCLGALSTPSVAIVGARAASPYGLTVAEHLAADLAGSGVTVVSGLARGVDSAAHRGALAGRGITIAVLGCGADIVYPPEHASLSRDIEQRGAIVSELVPGTPPLPPFFPQRNRIISGLSRAVVVIEAGEKSGSLITARCALEQGRDVLAVPGNVLSGRNRGAHGLLRDGAKIVESADDILEELGMSQGDGSRSAIDGRLPCPSTDPILACLTPGEPSNLDAIAERSGLSTARLLPRLFELEMRGVVARVGGGRFVRVDRTC
ncbi:MAG: DNA-protecting protein DprA [Acidobacteria bacterium]|nr:DNA-protecting protein DprA [Acidobacteriota bacterium]